MPSTRLLTRKESGYESLDTPDSVTNLNPELNSLNDQVSEDKSEVSNSMGLPVDLKPQNVEPKGLHQMGFENVKSLIPLQPKFMPQLNHPLGVPQNNPKLNHPVNQHVNQSHPNLPVNQPHPNVSMPPMNHPGLPMMSFPVFQHNEFGFIPHIRFPSKEMGSIDHMTPQAVLGRLSTHPMPSSSFTSQQSSFYGPSNHYTQFFDYKDESETDLAFLEYSGGVVYDNGPFSHGGRWLTFWEYKGRIWRKSFQVSLFGNDGARELAESFWVSKMRSIQLFNRNKQEKLLKMEHKKPESRGRKKKTTLLPQETQIPHLSLDPTLAAQYIMQDQGKKEVPNKFQKEFDKDEPLEITVKVREPKVDTEGLTWDPEKSCWSFEKVENDQLVTYTLPCEDREDGLKEIQALKEEYEYMLLQEYEESSVKGVVYDKTRMNWKVSHWVPSKGIKRTKLFSVTKLGYKEARDAAIKYKQAVDLNSGEEPEDMTPEPLEQEELFSDPMVKHFHKVLSSIAVREVKDGLS